MIDKEKDLICEAALDLKEIGLEGITIEDFGIIIIL